jgi:hypothetical protein
MHCPEHKPLRKIFVSASGDADLESVNLSLQAELAIDYFELRAADAQQRLLDDTVKAYSDSLELTQARLEGGASPESDVAQAKTQLDTSRVQATDISVRRARYEHAIAVLIGRPTLLVDNNGNRSGNRNPSCQTGYRPLAQCSLKAQRVHGLRRSTQASHRGRESRGPPLRPARSNNEKRSSVTWRLP